MRRRDHEKIVHSLERQNVLLQRLVENLTDRLMYATDKTWTPPPVREDLPVLEELPDYAFSPSHVIDAEPLED